MEFSYHFAHVKFPWFTHRESSMRTHGVRTMVISWNIHGVPMDFTPGFPWNIHGVQTMEISRGQNDMKIPWKFHGNSWVATMVIPWVCKPWKFHVGKMI